MLRPLMKKMPLLLGLSLVGTVSPFSLFAQLVRESPAPAQQTTPQDKNAASQSPPGKKRISQEVQITGEALWLDSGIDIQAGEHVLITASGKLRYADVKDENGPDGLPRGFKDLLRILPFNESGRGALIGRIGDKDTAQPFLIGARRDVVAPVSGRLFIGINEAGDDTGAGTYVVRIEVYTPEGGTNRVVAKQVNSLPGIDKNLFAKIPRRVSDKDGNPGDMVNFLLIGSEEQVKATFQAAGWVQVDRDAKDAVVQALVASLSKQAYLTMPMSQLYLFGRPQDYGFAHAEPLTVVTTRHHLRIWKSTLTVGGQPLWVGAATHDMGLERDQRNGKLTHHIDPNVDDERDFVSHSLTGSGYVTQHTSVLPSNPIKDEKTATGGSFHSNGEVLVLWLNSN